MSQTMNLPSRIPSPLTLSSHYLYTRRGEIQVVLNSNAPTFSDQPQSHSLLLYSCTRRSSKQRATQFECVEYPFPIKVTSLYLPFDAIFSCICINPSLQDWIWPHQILLMAGGSGRGRQQRKRIVTST